MATIRQFSFDVDLLRPLLWQYDGAPRLKTILQAENAWYAENHTQFWEDWQRDVFDLTTANDFGCAVWARILGMPLIAAQTSSTVDRFGFGVDGPAPPSNPSLDFSKATNSDYVALVFEDF